MHPQFFNIGKGVFTRMIGVQQNYTILDEYVYDELDEARTGCYQCPVYKEKELYGHYPDCKQYKDAANTCANCPHRKTTPKYRTVKKYINEANMYGYTPRLKKIALKLMIYLHSLCPDKIGMIKEVSIAKLANVLNCEKKTVVANLKVLEENKYIQYCICGKNATILLNEYQTYYLPSKKGGRGYLTLSAELLDKLMAIDDLTTLRLAIRSILEVDNDSKYTGSRIAKTYKELKRYLPDYCNRSIIKNKIAKADGILTTNAMTGEDDGLIIELKMKLPSEAKKEYRKIVTDKWRNIIPDIMHSEIGKKIEVESEDIESLAGMSIEYGYDEVLHALQHVVKMHSDKWYAIRNLGGLVRTVTRAMKKVCVTNTSIYGGAV